MTKQGKKRQEIPPLAIEQMNAIDQLVIGLTDQEVADKVGVARQTVTKWRLYHPGFQAELNKRRKEVWGSAADRLRSLLPKALDRIEKILLDDSNPNSWRAAVELLKAAGLHASSGCSLAAIGEDDPNKIVEGLAQREMSPMDSLSMGLEGGVPDHLIDRTISELLAKLEEPQTCGPKREKVEQQVDTV